jgi:hypothetical protein
MTDAEGDDCAWNLRLRHSLSVHDVTVASRRVPSGACRAAPASSSAVKAAVVAVLGGLLTLTGVALLVLPGPGFVLVAAGLAVLATEFAWARKPLDYAKGKAQQGLDEVARSRRRSAVALVAAGALLGVGVLEVLGVDLPLLNRLTAVFVLLSGLFLVGSVVHAHNRGSPDPGRSSSRAPGQR